MGVFCDWNGNYIYNIKMGNFVFNLLFRVLEKKFWENNDVEIG